MTRDRSYHVRLLATLTDRHVQAEVAQGAKRRSSSGGSSIRHNRKEGVSFHTACIHLPVLTDA